MTEVNGLRLAYRGFVAGLAGGYVWAALAMTLAALLHADPLRPLRPIALAVTPLAGSPELGFVVGLATIQAAGGLAGMCFAYFFARFFTVRGTVAAAAPCFTILVWALLAAVVTRTGNDAPVYPYVIGLLATAGFGLLLGLAVPLRREVTRG